jgi:SHS2 domain-containing protein
LSGVPVPGVTSLEHTADIALEIRAPDLPGLLERAALGMDWLLREGPPPDGRDEPPRMLELEPGEPPMLLRGLLRELLRWHERDGFAPSSLEVVGGPSGDGADEVVRRAVAGPLRLRIHGAVVDAPPVREIKGVTLHALAAEPRNAEWWGRVVFDV